MPLRARAYLCVPECVRRFRISSSVTAAKGSAHVKAPLEWCYCHTQLHVDYISAGLSRIEFLPNKRGFPRYAAYVVLFYFHIQATFVTAYCTCCYCFIWYS